MARIKKVSVKHFKSVWNNEMDLGQLNVFIGTNGAGKSNILEAIAVASASVDGGIDYPRLYQRGSRLSAPDIFRSSFKHKERKPAFSISVEMETYSYQTSINSSSQFSYLAEKITDQFGKKIAGRGNNGVDVRGMTLNVSKDKSIVPYLIALTDTDRYRDLADLAGFAIYSPSTPILRGTSEDNSKKNPLGLYGGRLAEALNELFSEVNRTAVSREDVRRFFNMFEWFSSFGPTANLDAKLLGNDYLSSQKIGVKYTDKYMNTKFNNLYAYDVSEGALYVLFMLVLLLHPKSPNIFAIDNIDSALNPGLIASMMGQIIQILDNHAEKQLFITTHHPTTLDCIDIFNPKHKLFVVERLPDGQTVTKPILPPDGMTREQWDSDFGGMSLSDIWLSGALGGIPTRI
ncbi:AAA family ATPase [Aeromonas caviae]